MAAPGLTVTDILGRKIDLIGNRTGIALDGADAGISTEIFETGDIAFRAGGGRVVIAYIIISLTDGPVLFDAGVKVRLGSQGSLDDWLGGTLDLSGVQAPVTLYPNILLTGLQLLPVYDPQTPFMFTNASIASSLQVATVSCYGWAEN